LASCSKNDSDESAPENFGTSTGNFLPLSINNVWTYNNPDNTLQIEEKIIGSTDVKGFKYFEYTSTNPTTIQTQYWYAKKGATYFSKIGDVRAVKIGFTVINIKSYELPILKDDYALNTNWTGSVSPAVSFSGDGLSGNVPSKIDYTGVNYFKGEVVLGDITYPNVIKTKIKLTINVYGQITDTEIETWFAENIGIIKQNGIANGIINQIYEINKYTLN
jgi:hypothetical protein